MYKTVIARGVFLWFVISLTITSCNYFSQNEPIIIHLIPQGYEGELWEVYEEEAPALVECNGMLIMEHKEPIIRYSNQIDRTQYKEEYFVYHTADPCTTSLSEFQKLKRTSRISAKRCESEFYYWEVAKKEENFINKSTASILREGRLLACGLNEDN